MVRETDRGCVSPFARGADRGSRVPLVWRTDADSLVPLDMGDRSRVVCLPWQTGPIGGHLSCVFAGVDSMQKSEYVLRVYERSRREIRLRLAGRYGLGDLLDANGAYFVLRNARVGIQRRVGQEVGRVLL